MVSLIITHHQAPVPAILHTALITMLREFLLPLIVTEEGEMEADTERPVIMVRLLRITLLIRRAVQYRVQGHSLPLRGSVQTAFIGCLIQAAGVCPMGILMFPRDHHKDILPI